jgi:membrane-associated phospholipid phosphatase
MGYFISSLPRNLLRSFSGRLLIFHAAAIAATILSVTGGFDWWYFVHTRAIAQPWFIYPAILLGGALQVVLPLVLLFLGKLRERAPLVHLAYALGQAVILGSVISSAYKTLTGRLQPDETSTALDISRHFAFGIFRHGIFWGWPSSHATIAFAMAVTLTLLSPRWRILKYGAIAYAFFVAIGVSMSIHWFSDAVAGALIGTAIGLVVGRSFGPLAAATVPSSK